ncbi:MAG: ABC transporter permease [Rhodospirillaceae bacterium]|nr:ABC transporter permease [Rhodospirillaceae bacterium]MBT5243602.1 ABC transporter permease [Rhodospirillaceae bacterium]MBT5562190.1 ABC transporter permease [Rhodospirillaceae bacterium]MBT6242363.1 ABC transporter permease [Rhodospirillaceae bacterium]MBT7138931.1 ABC transporter permease [Rhodospirillaceae bacterium]
MTTDSATLKPRRPSLLAILMAGQVGPVSVVLMVFIAIWYCGAVWMNSTWEIDRFEKNKIDWSAGDLVRATMAQKRPILPAPHQVLAEMNKTIVQKNITSKRSLIYHSWVTLSSTLLGFAIGGILGVLLAVGIVHNRTLEKSLMPWVISSQTIPILAIAPMIIVVLGAIGLKGLVPKAIISTYLCFFPITISMVKGLRSPGVLEMDLMRTYSASSWQTFWMLRWPASLPYLFTSLKVAIAISLVGAIVGELPTGAQAGLGARLLAGSYYGQTIQIWSALVTAAILAGLLVYTIGVIERVVLKKMGMAR